MMNTKYKKVFFALFFTFFLLTKATKQYAYAAIIKLYEVEKKRKRNENAIIVISILTYGSDKLVTMKKYQRTKQYKIRIQMVCFVIIKQKEKKFDLTFFFSFYTIVKNHLRTW